MNGAHPALFYAMIHRRPHLRGVYLSTRLRASVMLIRAEQAPPLHGSGRGDSERGRSTDSQRLDVRTIMKHTKESAPFYHQEVWKRLRGVALMRDAGMCCDCMEKFNVGLITAPSRATMVHHIIPIEERPDLALDLNNLRSLCDRCHNIHHPEKGRKRQQVSTPQGIRVIKI